MRRTERLKIMVYTTVIPIATMLCASPVYATEDGRKEGTVKGFATFKNLLQTDTPTRNLVNTLINLMKNVSVVLVAVAFAMTFISLVVSAGKLGTVSPLNPRDMANRHQAYDGMLHAIIGFAICGASGLIFSFIAQLFLG